jgi:hypothetical protein
VVDAHVSHPSRPPAAALIAIAIIVVAGLVIEGFGGKQGSSGGNATIVIVAEATTPPLDPHRVTGTIGLRIVDAIFDRLVREDMSKETTAAPEIKPALAESWKVSPDGKAYTFIIRKMTFQDGSPVDAAAVKKNFDRNDAYWGGKPRFGRIIFRPVPDACSCAPAKAGILRCQCELRPALEQSLQRALAFDARELVAQAEMDPGAKGDVSVRPSLEIELFPYGRSPAIGGASVGKERIGQFASQCHDAGLHLEHGSPAKHFVDDHPQTGVVRLVGRQHVIGDRPHDSRHPPAKARPGCGRIPGG